MAGGPPVSRHAERGAWLASALVVAAIVLGGGGSSHPATETALQLLAAAIGLAWLWLGGGFGQRRVPATLWAIAALVVALPLLQLVPLPPALWTALPGRAPEASALALIGEQQSWRPLTLSPPRTLAALLACLVPLLAMIMVARLDDRGRGLVIRTLAVMALASALLGAAQLVSGGDALRLYPGSHEKWVIGFQNNRNHEADLLLIGLVAMACAVRPAEETRGAGHSARWLGGWAIGSMVLLLAVVLTGSRTGIALIPLALLGQWLVLRPSLPPGPARSLPVVAACGVAGFAALAVLLRDNSAIGAVMQRFALTGDFRLELWRDAAYALRQYWPAGAGMGAFVPVMLAAERLEVVDQSYPNRAHNDFLELAVEAGVPGLLALAAITALLAWLALCKWRLRQQPGQAPQLWLGVAGLAIPGLHSIVDYPLRTMAPATVAGVAAGLLAPSTSSGPGKAS